MSSSRTFKMYFTKFPLVVYTLAFYAGDVNPYIFARRYETRINDMLFERIPFETNDVFNAQLLIKELLGEGAVNLGFSNSYRLALKLTSYGEQNDNSENSTTFS